MSKYIKQNFIKGQTLKADHLNHMEDGIASLSEQKISLPHENGTPNHGTAGQFAISDGKGGIVISLL